MILINNRNRSNKTIGKWRKIKAIECTPPCFVKVGGGVAKIYGGGGGVVSNSRFLNSIF